MIEIITAVLFSLLQNITYLGTILYLANHSLKRIFTLRFAISFACYSAILYLVQTYGNEVMPTSLLVSIGLFTIMTLIHSTCNITQALVISLTGFVMISLIQFVFILSVNWFIPINPFVLIDTGTYIVFILTAITTILLFHYIPVTKYVEKLLRYDYIGAILFIMMIILYIIITWLFLLKMFPLIPVSTSCMLALILLLFYIRQSRASYRKKQELDDYDTYIPVLNQLINDIEQKQLIYNAQLQSVTEALEKEDNALLKKELIEITAFHNAQKMAQQFLHLQNRLLAGLLYTKMMIAEEKRLSLSIAISDYTCSCQCSELELVDLTGILIDNAMEASKENDTIFITIDRLQDQFVFRIENPGPKADHTFLSNIFRPGFSTKENKTGHGIGLSILKKTLKKYNGDIIISNTEHVEHPGKNYICMEIHI